MVWEAEIPRKGDASALPLLVLQAGANFTLRDGEEPLPSNTSELSFLKDTCQYGMHVCTVYGLGAEHSNLLICSPGPWGNV